MAFSFPFGHTQAYYYCAGEALRTPLCLGLSAQIRAELLSWCKRIKKEAGLG